jgi:hypothetical protein
MFTKQFITDASERAIKTLAQTFLALVAGAEVFNAFTADWAQIIGVSVGAAILSYATSIVSKNIGSDKNSPSLLSKE